MKVYDLLQRCWQATGINSCKETRQLLRQQRLLARDGMTGSAEVIHSFIYDDRPGPLHRVQLWLKLKKADGSFMYTHAHTLVLQNKIPATGSMLCIRYNPHNPSSIIILQVQVEK